MVGIYVLFFCVLGTKDHLLKIHIYVLYHC